MRFNAVNQNIPWVNTILPFGLIRSQAILICSAGMGAAPQRISLTDDRSNFSTTGCLAMARIMGGTRASLVTLKSYIRGVNLYSIFVVLIAPSFGSG